MLITNIKRRIPQCVGSLILLKGLLNLILGILSVFFAVQVQASVLNHINILMMFWDFSPAKSLTAIIIGIGFIALGRDLYQGKKLSWQVALALLFLNLLDSSIPHIIFFQVLYTLVMILMLWLCRGSFTRQTKNPLRPQQTVAFLSIIFALAYGIIGCYLLRAQYQGINNLVDAIYYSFETYSTIGYGDILPITTNARIFTCTMIVLGVGSFIAAISILLGPAMEQRMKKVVNMVNKLSVPKNHVIIVGATILGLHTAKVLQDQGDLVILIDPDSDQLKLAKDLGYTVMAGNPQHEEILNAANIKTANAIICTLDSDAQNLLVTMVAHRLQQKDKLPVKIIVRIDDPQNMDYATQNGANQVISPAIILGQMVATELSSK